MHRAEAKRLMRPFLDANGLQAGIVDYHGQCGSAVRIVLTRGSDRLLELTVAEDELLDFAGWIGGHRPGPPWPLDSRWPRNVWSQLATLMVDGVRT